MKPANNAPVYAAAIYPDLAEIARRCGYALAVHGSLARDFDLICIPWIESPDSPLSVLREITETFAIEVDAGATQKLHGRVSYYLVFGFGDCGVDLSFMPTRREGGKV